MNLNHPDIPRQSSRTWLKLENGELSLMAGPEIMKYIENLPEKKGFDEIQGRKIYRVSHTSGEFVVFIQLFEGEEARDDLSLMELF